MGISIYAVLSALTMVVTGLVVARILIVRSQVMKLMGKYLKKDTKFKNKRLHDGLGNNCSPYLSIVTMLVESYALECAWSLGAAISVGLDSSSLYLFVANDSIVKVCELILERYIQGV